MRELAKKMILEAKNLDVIVSNCNHGLQTHCIQIIFKKNPISKSFFEKYALSENQLKLLANFSRNNGIDFSSTPYTFRELDF